MLLCNSTAVLVSTFFFHDGAQHPSRRKRLQDTSSKTTIDTQPSDNVIRTPNNDMHNRESRTETNKSVSWHKPRLSVEPTFQTTDWVIRHEKTNRRHTTNRSYTLLTTIDHVAVAPSFV